MREASFSLHKTSKTDPHISGLFFRKAKEKILGKKYILSLAFIDKTISRKLNKTYRGKDKPTDILSFPIENKVGEIFINLDTARKKAKLHKREVKNYIRFLFIHGLVHLKGYAHSSKMESVERKFRSFFKI